VCEYVFLNNLLKLQQINNNIEPNDHVDIADSKTGFSKFPGNVNVFIIRLKEYYDSLTQNSITFPEVIKPQWLDSHKKVFKTSVRLECMMQDISMILPQKTS